MVDVERGTTERARRRLVDVLCIADEIGSKPAGQSVVEVCAGMAALALPPLAGRLAAALAGRADALRAPLGALRPAFAALVAAFLAGLAAFLDFVGLAGGMVT